MDGDDKEGTRLTDWLYNQGQKENVCVKIKFIIGIKGMNEWMKDPIENL